MLVIVEGVIIRMTKLIESDLVKIRQALEKPSLAESLMAMEATLSEIGYEESRGITYEDINLPRGSESLFSSSYVRTKA
jgi:hypothetical protein